MLLWSRLAIATIGVMAAATHASACMCSGIRGRTPWETAEKEEHISSAIFEGTLERVTVEWNILSAKPGDLIRADLAGPEVPIESWPQLPRLVITFRVKRVYKGDVGATAQVRTGMGGGDCGAHYSTGLDYLVYAYGPKPTQLAVHMCSPGGWLGSNRLATELRHLRKERRIPSDTMDDSKDYWEPAAAARRDREREEYIKRYTAATGQICGVVSPPPIGDHQRVEIAFQPTIGHWVDGSGGVEVGRDGRFCSNRLGPGEYYLHYTRGPWTEYLESALYYPGVVDREKAAIVSVSAGQVRSNLVFKVPKQESYTVRGFISVDDKSGLGDDGAQALLIGLDGKIWRSQKIDFRSSFPLPKVKYFTFDDVLPGRYIASVWAPGQDWVTRIVDVNVSTHAKLIWLELKHRKAKR